ncbi:isoprenoid synthase domain-containing protein [Xylaria digitata]|nr:isoprenoid synthase domain-containing protein [Xylaria digitata]
MKKNRDKNVFVPNIVNELMSIDPLRGKEFIAIWTKGLGVGRDRTHFKDFDDYLDYRWVDVGSFLTASLVIFGMCLTIPPEEEKDFWRITRPIWVAEALTNDLQSWNKELVQTQDKTDMANSIWVLMKQYSIDIDDAKSRIRRRIRESVAEYLDSLRHLYTRNKLSPDTARLVEAMQYMHSSNLYWGNSAPRYHQDRSLTDFQIAREKNGWPYGSMDRVGDPNDSKDPERNEIV